MRAEVMHKHKYNIHKHKFKICMKISPFPNNAQQKY